MKRVCIVVAVIFLSIGWISLDQGRALAQQDITICAVHPFTGPFAFAGIHGADAMEDAIGMANEEGGINGKKINYFWADGEYKNDVGIAAFKRLYAQHNPVCMWGQSTGMTKALSPEIKERYKVLYSAYTFAEMAADPKENPYLFLPGSHVRRHVRGPPQVHRPGETRGQCGLLLRGHRVRARAHPGRQRDVQEARPEPGGRGSGQGRRVGHHDAGARHETQERRVLHLPGFRHDTHHHCHEASQGLRPQVPVHGDLLVHGKTPAGTTGPPGR